MVAGAGSHGKGAHVAGSEAAAESLVDSEEFVLTASARHEAALRGFR